MTGSGESVLAGETPTGIRAAQAGGVDLRAARVQGRVPDFFVIGHQKCGTTALYEMLRRHPQIFMPDVKEPRFFVPELLRPDRRLSTLEGYLSLFAAARPDQLVGEASPQYIRSPTAAREIVEMQPSARIIAVLREPASFLRSFHLQMVHRDIEPQRDFRKALGLEAARREGKRVPRGCRSVEPLMYASHVKYVEQLRRYGAVVPPERMLVLIYDDYRRDNEATLRSVLRFLEVDETVPLETVETRPLKAVRSQALRHLTDSARLARRDPSAASPLGRAVNALTPNLLRSEAFRSRWRKAVYRQPSPPDQELIAELRRRFKPEVVAVSEFLGRDLVREWGYDAID
jgi:hypothetical protein